MISPRWIVLSFVMLLFLPADSRSCSLCGTVRQRELLSNQFERADCVLVGRLANPRLNDGPGSLPGSGRTDVHVERVLKASAKLPIPKVVVFDRYIPVLDPKDPPRFVVFMEQRAGELATFSGVHLKSPTLADFFVHLQKIPRTDPIGRLKFCAGHFGSSDAAVAEEAFLEWAKSPDPLVAQAARQLGPETLRKILQNPELEPEQISMFSYLLGACGTSQDAELLAAMIRKPTPKQSQGFEGVLAGFIALDPMSGWKQTTNLLEDAKQPILLRLAAIRTLRFFFASNPKDHRDRVSTGLAPVLHDGSIADLAINELRTTEIWDHTDKVFSYYKAPSHDSAIIRGSIVRYALACPLPSAKTFVAAVRQSDPNLVSDLEEERRLLSESPR